MAHSIQEEEPRGRPGGVTKYFLLLAVVIILLLGAAFFLMRPYARLERLARDAISRHAPAGTSIGDLNVVFPLDIILTNLVVPVRVRDRQREIRIEKLTGGVSVLPLLLGELDVGVKADSFGGSLWLDISIPASLGEKGSRLGFDVRARGVDIASMGEFLRPNLDIRGRCDLDFEGKLNERDLTTLNGQGLAKGRNIHLPTIDVDRMILPENRGVEFSTRLSASDGKLIFDNLKMDGSAYEMSGQGSIRIKEPVGRSPIDSSFSVVFYDPPTITDRRLANMGAESLMNALVESGAEVFFDLSGPISDPDAEVDLSSSLGSILRANQR